MSSFASNALSKLLKDHVLLSATRRQTLVWLVLLLMRHGSVSLWRLAAHVDTAASTDSVRRRFYRFFQHVTLDGAAAARLVVALLGLRGKPWVLAIDRTNWEFGKTSINILMVSVIWNGVGIPLIWSLLPTSGCSSTKVRTDLLDQLKTAFPDMRVSHLLGDREFIGDGWMAYLVHERIPFVLRLRDNQYVRRGGYVPQTLASIGQHLRCGQSLVLRGWCRLGVADDAPRVRLVILRLDSGHLLALASSSRPQQALAAYRQRWTIESLFGVLKTKGFNLEDTHLTDRRKLSTLLTLLALAVAMTIKTGHAAAALTPIGRKAHGRKAWSLFALGLVRLRKLFAKLNQDQVFNAFRLLMTPDPPPNSLIRLSQ